MSLEPSLDGHLRSTYDYAATSFPEASLELRYRRLTQYSLRLHIGEALFIEVYFNSQNRRQSYALIKGEKRVFGCDNVGGWHWHPLVSPEAHEPCTCEPSLCEIFSRLREAAQAVTSA